MTTRQALQQEALRLFRMHGYERTTVAEVAAAAGVSEMTFYRYFGSKDDVVFADEYDPLVGALVAAHAGSEGAIGAIGAALVEGLVELSAEELAELRGRIRLIAETPALRAALWERQGRTQELIADALGGIGGETPSVRARVAAAVGVAAVTVALLEWAEDEQASLVKLVEAAFAVVAEEARTRG